MANGGPRVTLTFAGDTSNLEKSTQRVGESTQNMSNQVGESSRRFQESGSRMTRFSERMDDTDTKAMGFRDTITGVGDTFRGLTDESMSTEERLLTLGMGIGDLASGFVNLLIPAVTALAGFLRTGLVGAFNLVMAHPVAAALIALAGIFVLLWTNSETFRDIVTSVFNAIWGVVQNFAGWIGDRFGQLWSWLQSSAQSVGSALSGIWDMLMSGGRTAVNFVIDMLNGAISALNQLVGGINNVPGVNIPSIPTIPKLHTGGRVPGSPGTETMAILQAGERVTPATQANREARQGGAAAVRFVGNTDTAVASMIMQLVRAGKIQL